MPNHREYASELAETSDCLLDSYTSNFAKHFAGRLDSSVARAELLGCAVVLHTDTASTERVHDVNKRRQRMRVHSHDQELGEVLAWWCARTCAESRPFVVRNTKQRRVQRGNDEHRDDNKTGKPIAPWRWSWVWRAFLHVEAKGRWLGPEVVSELSDKFRNLDDERLEHFQELAAFAADRVRHGERAFGRRVRNRPPASAGQSGAPSRLATAPAGEPGSGEGPARGGDGREAEAAVAAGEPEEQLTNRIVEEAKLALRDVRSAEDVEKAEEDEVVSRILEHSKKVVEDAMPIWSLIGRGAEGLQPGVDGRLSLVAEASEILVFSWQKPTGSVSGAAAQHLARTTIQANEQRWQKLHR